MNLSFSKNCLSLWGLDRSGRGVYIIVRVYLLSVIKFPLIFFPAIMSMPLLYKMKYLQVNKSTKPGLSQRLCDV